MSANDVKLSFGVEWQMALLKLLTSNDDFARKAGQRLKVNYFDGDVLRWIFDTMTRHAKEFHRYPSAELLAEYAKRLDPSIRDLYVHALEKFRDLSVADADWVRSRTLDFISRNIFVGAMLEAREQYNSGNMDHAINNLRRDIEEVLRMKWERSDEEWFFEGLAERQIERVQSQRENDVIGTGIAPLDQVLDGGLSPGELGIWMAYPKIGKSTTLISHGLVATRGHFKNVVHFVLEGSRRLVSTRYDTAFMNQLYTDVKRGSMNAQAYSLAFEEYRSLRRKLLVVGLTDKWEYTVEDLYAIVRDKYRSDGWRPDLVIVDYADLLVGRKSSYSNDYVSQADAYRDLKTFTSRDKGYAIWTAAQARRPENREWNVKRHELTSKDISGMYDKVRVTDFLGSLNATDEEKRQSVLRLYAELYRDNPADKVIEIDADFSRMHFGRVRWVGERSPEPANGKSRANDLNPNVFGYRQVKAPNV